MKLQVFNTMKKKKEIFTPLLKNKIFMYVCGMTVYDYAHLGHARAYTAFDVMLRFFKYLKYEVTYVRNITDIDDKIIKRAKEEIDDYQDDPLSACLKLTEKYTTAFHEDMRKLGLLDPNIEPKATMHIDEIIKIIQGLIDKGYAYEASGSVYFRISKYKDYGALSGRDIEDVQTQCRLYKNQDKEHSMDFVLWKKHQEGEPFWESSFGKGRPGWHIECSAMSMQYLGADFDIHGGGQDLIFPHHENEICQSRAYSGKGYARYWLHNGFITVSKEKMSKSLKNFRTVRELLKCYKPMDLKFYLLSTHYRSPLDFNDNLIKSSREGLQKINDTISRTLERLNERLPGEVGELTPSDEFLQAMHDDFNTPKAVGAIFNVLLSLNKLLSKSESLDNEIKELYLSIISMLEILGVKPEIKIIHKVSVDEYLEIENHLAVFLNNKEAVLTDEDISGLLKARGHAKSQKNFSLADEIRNYLTGLNIDIRDGADSTTWQHSTIS